jgi:predicted PurR-regulated permease PerM
MAVGENPHRERGTTASRVSLAVLIAMAVIAVALTLLLLSPFVPGLVWAFSLAVVAWPLHERIAGRIRWPSVAAGLSTALVTVTLLVPTALLAWHVGSQASQRFEQAQTYLQSGQFHELLERYPALGRAYGAMSGTVSGDGASAESSSKEAIKTAGQVAQAWLAATLAALLQIAIALFTLFFLFRDRRAIVNLFRSLLPMSKGEADYFLEQIRGMTHATIYGTLVVAGIQGMLGGLMFALLGIPGALLWGMVMAVLSIIPSAGAFLVWLPTAVVLAAQGEAVKAAILGLWGLLAVSTIDNVLYPLLVGQEVRLHTLPVFLAVIGGLAIFGAAGIVLGPVILAATIALINILAGRFHKRRPVRD